MHRTRRERVADKIFAASVAVHAWAFRCRSRTIRRRRFGYRVAYRGLRWVAGRMCWFVERLCRTPEMEATPDGEDAH